MKLDDRENDINVCLFESYLAKFFVENDEYFHPIMHKIIDILETLNALNSENKCFQRMVYSTFSTVNMMDKRVVDFKDLRHASILIFDTFIKFFLESCLSLDSLEMPNRQPISQVPAKSHGFFNDIQMHPSPDLALSLRQDELFTQSNRGADEISLDFEDESPSYALGILAVKDTPDELKDYFSFDNYPSRTRFSPQKNGLMAQWMRVNHVPIISGCSGSIGKILSMLNDMMLLSSDDIQMLTLLVSVSSIALGHHSFFEVLKPLDPTILKLKIHSNLYDFYKQVIPSSILSSDLYQAFINSENGSQLLREYEAQNSIEFSI